MLASVAQAQDYRIQPGDTLRVEVLEDTSLNREVLVAPDGRISVPLAGVLRVGGASLAEAQRRLVGALEPNFATPPTVLVSLVALNQPEPPDDPDQLNIYVIGEVNSPGLISGENGITLLQSLAMAGGVTDFAATKRIQLRRTDSRTGTETVYRFNYDQVIEGLAGIGTTELAEGDVIVVPTRRLFE
jgi:polysaccharide export outer membrane protein